MDMDSSSATFYKYPTNNSLDYNTVVKWTKPLVCMFNILRWTYIMRAHQPRMAIIQHFYEPLNYPQVNLGAFTN